MEDCSIAAIQLHLAATDMGGWGVAGVQIQLREHNADCTTQDYVAELLGLKL